MLLYSHAVSMLKIVDWYHGKTMNLWTSLDNDLFGPDITSLPLLDPDKRPPKAVLPLMVQTTLQVWVYFPPDQAP